MKFFILFILFVSTSNAQQISLKLLTFNTMCEFCHKHDDDKFVFRKDKIKKIIKDSKAQVIALQEVIRKSQVEFFIDKDKYDIHFYENSLISYPDAVIALKKKDFIILKRGHFWLGENTTSFNLGWKVALPRILLWVKARHIQSKREFTFLATHFDNRLENLAGSANIVNNFAKESENVIFLGDTNSTYEMDSYKILTKNMKDLAMDFEGGREYCYLKKGKKFPECRVDHIMTNIQNAKSSEYKVILDKIKDRFPSDHRPIYLEVFL